jgi:hypothetical protein
LNHSKLNRAEVTGSPVVSDRRSKTTECQFPKRVRCQRFSGPTGPSGGPVAKLARGAIPRLKGACSLRDDADDATLARFNIPEALRSGFNGNTIFVMQKNDHLLWP